MDILFDLIKRLITQTYYVNTQYAVSNRWGANVREYSFPVDTFVGQYGVVRANDGTFELTSWAKKELLRLFNDDGMQVSFVKVQASDDLPVVNAIDVSVTTEKLNEFVHNMRSIQNGK